MADKNRNKTKINITAKQILDFLAVGGMLVATVVAPNAVQIFKFRSKDENYVSWKEFNQFRVRQNIYRLQKQGLIKRSVKDNQRCYILTDRGKRFVLKYNINRLQLSRPRRWDEKWRIIIFDIREKKKIARDALRNKLKNLGMLQLQKSVFVYPFDCKKEIDFVSDFFGVADDILYLEAEVHEVKEKLKNFFDLA